MSKIQKYQALDFNGKVLASGNTLDDVHGVGNRIIVDYKAKRYAIQGFWPPSRLDWHSGISNVSELLRAA